MSCRPVIAVTTGTYDLWHPGHLQFLKTCHSLLPRGAQFYVFLTTDELATRQKRKPLFDYEHRRALLLALPWITQVMAHNGDTKLELHQKFPFDVCFIGEEYVGTKEYSDIANRGVVVHYIPDSHNRAFSTSSIVSKWAMDREFELIAEGTCGSVFKCEDLIIKTVRISQLERDGLPNANVYNLPIPAPRNWKKKGVPHIHPMLPGFNSFRELFVQDMISKFEWCTTVSTSLAWERATRAPIHPPTEDFRHIKFDKAEPQSIYYIRQRNRGPTLHQWIESNPVNIPAIQSVVDSVRNICADLHSIGLAHGDLHAMNLVVEVPKRANEPVASQPPPTRLNVYLIDFGWCMHRDFHMEPNERAEYERCLRESFDWQHFVDAMEWQYGTRAWFSALRF